jgi:hypothetical protein
MSNMPANIWAKTGYGCKATGYWHDEPILPNHPQNAGTEYTRADLHRAEVEALQAQLAEARAGLEKLQSAAGEVSRQGAVTGPQWTRLNIALLSARATLAKIRGGE